jgi:ATP-binding cassette, subfamily A (ABC1), member 3
MGFLSPSLFTRQVYALVWKDLLLVLNRRRRWSTLWRAVYLPTIFTIYFAFILKVYWPKETYGIGTSVPVRSLLDGFNAAKGDRNTIALLNHGPSGGDIDRVIQTIVKEGSVSGKRVLVLNSEDEMLETCRSTLYGTTRCYGAAEFFTSPTEGGKWNYTLRADGGLGGETNVQKSDNDQEVYPLPLQRAIDSAIVSVNSSGGSGIPTTYEYPYSRQTQKEWDDSIVINIQKATVNYLSVVWYLSLIGLCYQLVGVIAREREQGMAELVESMMPNKRRWEPHLARVLGHFYAFTLVSRWFTAAVFLLLFLTIYPPFFFLKKMID